MEGERSARFALWRGQGTLGAEPVVWYGRHSIDQGLITAESSGLLRALRRRVRRPEADTDPAPFEAHGRLLFDVMFPEVIKAAIRLAPPGELTITADPSAPAVPWPLLHDGRSFLGLRWAMGELVASATSTPWQRRPRSDADASSERLLVVADPAGDLPAARYEGERLIRELVEGPDSWACDLRTGHLRCADFLRILNGFRMVHFAGHGDAGDDQGPGGWRFGDRRLGEADLGVLAGGEGPSLVFANACRSSSDALVALQSAMLAAGVRHFIGTLVDLPDLPGADFAVRFYAALRTGSSVGSALRAARQAAFDAGQSVWGAYRLIGDPKATYFKPRLEKRSSAGTRRGVVLAVRRPAPDRPVEQLAWELAERRRALRELVESHGGRLLPGRAAVERAVFGVPTSLEHDTIRAARAALRLGPELAQTGSAVIESGPLISTGLDVIGRPAADAEAATWRLPPGVHVLPGAARRLAARGLFGPAEPCGALPLLGLRPTEVPVTPTLVGRSAEMSRLNQVAQEILQSRSPRAITVVGPAGVGKSRLVLALSGILGERFEVLCGASVPYEQTSPYAALSGVLRALIGVSEEADDETLRLRLATAVDELDAAQASTLSISSSSRPGETTPPDPDDLSLPSPVVSIDALLDGGIHAPPRIRQRLDGLWAILSLRDPAQGHEPPSPGYVPAAFRMFVAACAATRGLMLIIEDLQWLPDAALAVVDELVAGLRAVPVLVVCTARAEFLDRAPHWFDSPGHVRMDLGPLSTTESEALLHELAPEGLASSAVRSILARAEGNPLYLRELGLSQLERPRDTALPASIEEVMQARLDRQTPFECEVLRAAAVMGRSFWQQAIEKLLDRREDVGAALRQLETRRFIVRQGISDLPGYHEWRFTHALLQEVVYRGTGTRARRSFHARAALWLSKEVRAASGDLWARIAAHFAEAGDAARSAQAWLRAAARAAEGHAPAEAQQALEAALAQDDAAGGALESGVRATAEVELADLARSAGDLGLAARCLDAAVKRTPADQPIVHAERLRRRAEIDESQGQLVDARQRLAEAVTCLADLESQDACAIRVAVCRDQGWLIYRDGDYDQAITQLEALLADVPETAHELLGSVHNAIGVVCYSRGDHDRAGQRYRKALAEFEAARLERRVAILCNNLGILAEKQGDFDAAIEWHRKGLRIKVTRGDRTGLARCYNNLGTLYWNLGDYARARDFLLESIRIKKRAGDAGLAVGYANLGEVYLATGQLEEAQRYLEHAIALCDGGRGPGYLLPDAWRMLAEVRLGQGQAQEAVAAARRALKMAHEHGDRPRSGAAARTVGEALSALGDADGAEASFAEAVEILEALDQPLELGKAYAAHARHLTERDPAGAAALGDRARALFEALGAAGELARLDPAGRGNSLHCR